MITVSETAAKKLNSLIEESGFVTPFVRVAVKGGGCSGLSYDLSFDTEQHPSDTLAEDKGVKILVDNKLCTRTTVENPFMNPSIVDIQYNSNRPAACDIDKVKDRVENNFKKRVFKDVNDIWGKDYSAREFYTVPSTTIPNDQEGYAKWLYGTPATCKEGNGLECKRNTYRYILR